MADKILLPEKFRKIITQPDYVERKLYRFWNKHCEETIKWLGPELASQKLKYEMYIKNGSKYFSKDLDNPPRGQGKFRANLRHGLGYTALPEFSSNKLGFKLFSEKALRFLIEGSTDNKITDDHFFGTRPIGSTLFKKYVNSNFNLDYILNEYLPSNIFKFLTVSILDIGEHTKDNKGNPGIARGDIYTIEQKIEGLHYKAAGITLPLIVTNEKDEELI